MLLFHKDREIRNNAIDYGDGTVMIQYKDNDDVAIVPKSEIKRQEADSE
jgi:hypothetical protein